jgi:hypothetical protein
MCGFLFCFKISKNKVPLIERPTIQQKEEEKKELTDLFVNLSDESDTELDFVPKKKVISFFVKKKPNDNDQ